MHTFSEFFLSESKSSGKLKYNFLVELYNILTTLIGNKIDSNDFIDIVFKNISNIANTLECHKLNLLNEAIKNKFLKTIAHASVEAMVLSVMPKEIALHKYDNKIFVIQTPENKDCVDIVYKYADEQIAFEIKAVTKYNNLMFSSENQRDKTDYIIVVLYDNTDNLIIKDIKIINNEIKPDSLYISTAKYKNCGFEV